MMSTLLCWCDFLFYILLFSVQGRIGGKVHDLAADSSSSSSGSKRGPALGSLAWLQGCPGNAVT